jgi:hypothetical protein
VNAELQHLGYEGEATAFCGVPATKRVPFVTEPVCPECTNRGSLERDALLRRVKRAEGFVLDLMASLEAGPLIVQMIDGEVVAEHVDEATGEES